MFVRGFRRVGQYRRPVHHAAGLHGSYLILILFALDLLSVGSMVAVYFAQWVCCLAAGWTRRKQIPAGKPAEGPVEWRPLLRGFLPYGLETAGAKIDVWAFSLFSAALPLGHYVGALALMTPVGLISSALTSGSTARLDWTNQREIKKYLFRTAVVLGGALVALAVGGWLLGGAVLVWVLGDTFQGGEWMIPWVAFVVVGNAAGWQLHSALQLSGRLDAYLFVQSAEPALRMPLVLGLAWVFAEAGIFAGMALGSTIKVIWCWRLLSKDLPRRAVSVSPDPGGS
jgi:O-antigen/teichoic acid export membrane protein